MVSEMTNTEQRNGIFDPDFLLSPNEQDLLMTALNSNKPSQHGSKGSVSSLSAKASRPAGPRSSSNPQQLERTGRASVDHFDAFASPLQQTPGSVPIGLDLGFEESPFLDFDLDDGSFDWDPNGEQMIGALPGTSVDDEEGDLHDKRKASDDDGDENEGGGKRRESEGKQSKKPGRKPLTSEPTSKRKAQNRAAQRAFRERKERHLKELETKVEDLEKASESTNHENGILRAQVERLQTELKEYRKQLSSNASIINQSPPQAMGSMNYSRANWDFDNNFNFEFPVFGAPQPVGTVSNVSISKVNALRQGSTGSSNTNIGVAARNSPTLNASPTSFSAFHGNLSTQTKSSGLSRDNIADLNSFSHPPINESTSHSASTDYLGYTVDNLTKQSPGRSHVVVSPTGDFLDYNTSSPSISSNSQNGVNSSCVTTPETSAASPEQQKSGELIHSNDSEAPSSALKTPSGDLQNFDWQFLQNSGTFDPVLFADYRDPQESIMSSDFGAFFNEALPTPDAISTSNQIPDTNLPRKRDLMQEMESAVDKEPEAKVVPAGAAKQFLTCNMLWDRVQRSEKVQSGEADIDELCLQLKAKAKCSGSGPVIDQKDVDAILGSPPDSQKDFLRIFT